MGSATHCSGRCYCCVESSECSIYLWSRPLEYHLLVHQSGLLGSTANPIPLSMFIFPHFSLDSSLSTIFLRSTILLSIFEEAMSYLSVMTFKQKKNRGKKKKKKRRARDSTLLHLMAAA